MKKNEEIPANKKIKALKIVHDHLVKKNKAKEVTYQDKVNAVLKLKKLVKEAHKAAKDKKDEK